MKKIFTLALAAMVTFSLSAQNSGNTQPDLNQLQQKVKSLQATSNQLKMQVNDLKTTQAQSKEEVATSLKNLETLVKAQSDTLALLNAQVHTNITEISSVSSASLWFKIAAVVALALALVLLILQINFRSVLSRWKEEEDLKILQEDEKLEKKVLEILDKLRVQSEEISGKIQAEDVRISELRVSLLAEFSAGLEELRKSLARVQGELREELDAHVKKNDSEVTETQNRFAHLGTRLDSGLQNFKAEMLKAEEKWKHELAIGTEKLGKEASELKKSLLALIKPHKESGA